MKDYLRTYYLLILVFSWHLGLLYAQDVADVAAINLVMNHSFEEQEETPSDYGQINWASGWFGLQFTPDLFANDATQTKVAAPRNFFGEQDPANGKAYSGILAYHENQQREFVATALSEPLQAGHAYYISFKVSLAEAYSNLACNRLGALLTNDLENAREGASPQVQSKAIIQEYQDWAIISDTIIAEEDYSFLVIGNFYANEQVTTLERGNRGYPAAYYYIDEVVVKPVEIPILKEGFIKISGKVKDQKTGKAIAARLDFVLTNIKYRAYEEANAQGKYEFSNMQRTTKFLLQASAKGYHSISKMIDVGEKDEVVVDFEMQPSSIGSTVVLESIVFESGEAVLHERSFEELNMIAKFLKEHPNYHVEISGHTDNLGQANKNLQLSEARAQAVVSYLHKQKNVKIDRLQAKGYGQEKPIASNDSEEGRKMNRRVELTIVKD